MLNTLKRALSAIVGIPGQLEQCASGVKAIPRYIRASQRMIDTWEGELTRQETVDEAEFTARLRTEECDNLKCAISIIRDAIEHQRAYAASTGHDADMWRSEGIAWCQNLMRCYDGFTIDNRIDDLHQSQERLVGENLGLLRKNKELEQQLAAERELCEMSRKMCNAKDKELAAEREAHAEDRRALQQVEQYFAETERELGESNQKLTSALDKLDKLTRWRKLSEEPCPESITEVEWSEEGRASMGRCLEDDLGQFDYWRFTPESLQALEESEGGE